MVERPWRPLNQCLFGVEVTIVPNVGERSANRATVAEARRAFFEGDFERCVALCEAIRPTSDSMRFEVAILQARVFVRLDQPAKAIDSLRSCAYTPLTGDEFASGEMVLGSAYVRLGQIQRGISLLERIRHERRAIHPTILAEVTMNLGVARYLLGDSDEAYRLLASVEPAADIVHARAQEYLGWRAFASDDVAESAARFSTALQAVDNSKHHDRFVEANVLKGLTSVSTERLDAEAWPALEVRLKAYDWSANGLSSTHFWTAVCASMLSEMVGESVAARGWARRAEEASPELTHAVMANCRMASIFRGIGEHEAQFEFAVRAQRSYERLSVHDLVGDFSQVPIALAEELAYVGLHKEAARLVEQYRDIVAPSEKRAPARERYAAVENAVEALLLELSGQKVAAARLYETAFKWFDHAGLLRRSCLAAFRLAELTHDSEYVDYLHRTLEHLPKYWVTRELARFDRDGTPRLSTAQAEILRLVAEGKTYKEMGALRGGSWMTARNLVHGLFRKFDVRSKGELVAAAARRGLLDRAAKDSAPDAHRSHGSFDILD